MARCRRSKADKLLAIIEATVSMGPCTFACAGKDGSYTCTVGVLTTERGVVRPNDLCPWGEADDVDWEDASKGCPIYADSTSGDRT